MEEARETKAKVELYNSLKEQMRSSSISTEERLRLNSQILTIAGADYQFWNERKEMLEQLMEAPGVNVDELMKSELELTMKLLPTNSKAYVVWYHRKWATMKMTTVDWDRERALCAKMIGVDSRNCLFVS